MYHRHCHRHTGVARPGIETLPGRAGTQPVMCPEGARMRLDRVSTEAGTCAATVPYEWDASQPVHARSVAVCLMIYGILNGNTEVGCTKCCVVLSSRQVMVKG